jgi:predicted secreted protein
MAIKSFGVGVTVATNAVGELTDVSVGGGDVNFIEITNHDSSGNWKEFLGGLKDGGTLDLTGNYKVGDVGQAHLFGNLGASAACVVTFSDSSTCSFTAIIGPYNTSNPLDGTVEFTASLKITGAVTYEAA